LKAAGYLPGLGKVRAHVPPDRRQTAWNDEPAFQFTHNIDIVVRAQKTKREGEPLPARNTIDHIEQKHEQVIGVTSACGQGFFVPELEVDQSRAICLVVIDHIRHRGISM
jgi:hypothetical protein